MAARNYHISEKTGRPNICDAQPGKCPLQKGEEDVPHFTGTKEEAKAWAEEHNAEKAGGTFGHGKRKDPAEHDASTDDSSGDSAGSGNSAGSGEGTSSDDSAENTASDASADDSSVSGAIMTPDEKYTSISDKKERANKMIEDLSRATEKVIASGELHRYMDAMRANGLNRWSFQNRMLATMQVYPKLAAEKKARGEGDEEVQWDDYMDPAKFNVQGMKSWNEQGRKVKKGSSSVQILAPVLVADKDQEEVLNRKTRKLEHPKRLVGFRTISVFNVTDTEGEEVPKAPGVNEHYYNDDVPDEVLDDMRSRVKDLGYEYSEEKIPGYSISSGSGTHAYVSPKDNRVVVDSRMPKKQKAAALAHELAHIEAGHVDDYEEYKKHRGQMETEAEMAGYLVMRDKGLVSPDDGSDAFSAAYIASWARDEEGQLDTKKVNRAMDKATKAYMKITEAKS